MDKLEIVALDRMTESHLNPRRFYDPERVAELAESIKSVGIIEPIVSRNGGDYYEIIAGSRRFRAAKLAGLTEAPTIVRELTDEQALEIMVIENNQREDVNALEEARGYAELLKRSYTLERLAAKIGRSHKYVYDRLKLLELAPEAQQLLYGGKITPGHAILLARLKPEDQKRAIDIKGVDWYRPGGVFQAEHDLFDADREEKKNAKDPLANYSGFKARSVRELEAWIDRHVRFDKKAPVDPMLFPETAATLQAAAEEKEKVVQITHNLQSPADAKAGNTERIYHGSSWKRADGRSGKTCEKSVTGVIVVGADRGQAFKVCLRSSNCNVHWAKERRERERRTLDRLSGGEGEGRAAAYEKARKAEQERAERFRAAFDKAKPAIVKACAQKIKTAKFGAIAQIVSRDRWSLSDPLKLIPKPKTLEDLARLWALAQLLEDCNPWGDAKVFKKMAKLIGVDVAAMMKAEEKPEAQTSAEPRAGKGYDEPTCTKWHCTELAPCIDGLGQTCGWYKLNKKTNAGTCTSCAAKEAQVDSKSTPKAPKKKSKSTKSAKM